MAATLRRILHLSTFVALSWALTACMHWKELAPQTETPALDSAGTYRFILADGDTTVVDSPSVRGDSVFWTVPRPGAVGISAIRSIAVQKIDVVTSVGSAGMAAFLIWGLFVARVQYNPF